MFALIKLLVASAISVCGVLFLFRYDSINYFTAAVGGSCFAVSFLLAFYNPVRKSAGDCVVTYKNLRWSPGEFTRHWLITGDTGVGKSSSGFNPLLHQISMSRPNWGGIVLGAKGDEHFTAREHAEGHGRPDDLCVLSVRPNANDRDWEPPERYNLISDRRLPWTTHAKNLVDTGASLTEGEQSSFFKPAAQQALTAAFELLEMLERPVTLTRAYNLLTDSFTMSEHFEALCELEESEQGVKLARYFDQTFLSAQAAEQKEGIIGTIKVFLGFFTHPDIAEIFSSEEPNTFDMADVDRGKILATAMPQTFQTERRYINTFLKLLFYTHAMMRFDKPKPDRKDENLLLAVLDEFQALATASEDGISDHNVIDRLRAANCCLILGMQSDASLFPVLGKEKAQVLTLNCRSRIAFRQPDPEGAEAVAQFISKKKITKVSKTSKFMGMDASTTKNQEWDYEVQPGELMKMKDHTAWIVHPSKKKVLMTIPPRDGAGNIPAWWETVKKTI
ncbi:MAG: type IV secretory system conjugative DNA transfer family protein [Verrucomicrobiae bacterium]|nr:type IV secretory system conjugative DNA transfer family protein [Verrucomicrobiae bacterium]